MNIATTYLIKKNIIEQFGRAGAEFIGLIHDWIKIAETKKKSIGIVHEGKRWIYNSAQEWEKQLVISARHIQRITPPLAKSGILIVDKLGYRKRKNTNFYTLNYELMRTMGLIKVVEPKTSETTAKSPKTKESAKDKKSFAPSKPTNTTVQDMLAIWNETFPNNQGTMTKTIGKYLYAAHINTFQEDLGTWKEYCQTVLERNPQGFSLEAAISFKTINSYKNPEKMSSEQLQMTTALTSTQPTIATIDESAATDMLNYWNAEFKGKAEKTMTPDIQKQLSEAFTAHFKSNIDEWKCYCQAIASSQYIMGDKFILRLIWALKPETMEKIFNKELGVKNIPSPQLNVKDLSQDHIAKMKNEEDPFLIQIRQKFIELYGHASYQSWFSKVGLCVEKNNLIIVTNSLFSKNWINQHFPDIFKYVEKYAVYDSSISEQEEVHTEEQEEAYISPEASDLTEQDQQRKLAETLKMIGWEKELASLKAQFPHIDTPAEETSSDDYVDNEEEDFMMYFIEDDLHQQYKRKEGAEQIVQEESHIEPELTSQLTCEDFSTNHIDQMKLTENAFLIQIRQKFIALYGHANYQSWLSKVGLRVENKKLIIVTDKLFFKNWIIEHFPDIFAYVEKNDLRHPPLSHQKKKRIRKRHIHNILLQNNDSDLNLSQKMEAVCITPEPIVVNEPAQQPEYDILTGRTNFIGEDPDWEGEGTQERLLTEETTSGSIALNDLPAEESEKVIANLPVISPSHEKIQTLPQNSLPQESDQKAPISWTKCRTKKYVPTTKCRTLYTLITNQHNNNLIKALVDEPIPSHKIHLLRQPSQQVINYYFKNNGKKKEVEVFNVQDNHNVIERTEELQRNEIEIKLIDSPWREIQTTHTGPLQDQRNKGLNKNGDTSHYTQMIYRKPLSEMMLESFYLKRLGIIELTSIDSETSEIGHRESIRALQDVHTMFNDGIKQNRSMGVGHGLRGITSNKYHHVAKCHLERKKALRTSYCVGIFKHANHSRLHNFNLELTKQKIMR